MEGAISTTRRLESWINSIHATIQLWKLKQIKINVIGIGVNLPFLRKMARATGGQGKFFTD